jgi:pyrimidine operon attenuation protein/uracil phosphoribosyltransferase
MKKILQAEQVEKAMDRLYRAIVKDLPTAGRVGVVGIRSRGEQLAKRIMQRLSEDRPKLQIDFGVLDITFYRDDLSRHRGAPVVRSTEIDFDLDDIYLLLVDDVLQTGRSIRAALGAIHDFGRPRVVRLAVLIDRGGRELPIAADFVAEQLTDIPVDQTIKLKLKESDGEEGVFIVKKQS